MKDVVLITGGTGAIGKSIAQCLGKEGYTIVVNCHPQDEQRSVQVVNDLKQEGLDVQLEIFDVTNADACQSSVAAIEKTVGGISVLVNAAGITRDAKLVDMEADQWHAVIKTNLDGVYNTTRPCIAHMTAQGYGRIINISSVNGQRGQIGQTNYSAAKAGMTGFTKALARELAREGITVNSVSPGYVDSPMIQTVPEAIRERLIKEIPARRFAEPFEIARAVAFLAHRDSGYITGTDMSINGGYHIS